jgi:Alpha/beta hydrolase domain
MVMGLGYAVTRDIGSFLRYQTHDDAGNANPLALSANDVGIRRAYSSGTSFTAMYERDYLYLGFNEDEAHRKVFDAVTVYHGGAYRLFANVEFADPNIYSRQDDRHDFLSRSVPPLTFAVTTDPISGIRDGILKRPATDPLVFQIDGEAEFWQWQDELNVVDGLGNPLPVPDNVRLYLDSGFSHINVAGLLSPPLDKGICQNLRQNAAGSAPSLRALTVALAMAEGFPPACPGQLETRRLPR